MTTNTPVKLTHLPTDILHRIFSFLMPRPTSPPLSLTLDYAKQLTPTFSPSRQLMSPPLSPALLSLASACPVLCRSVVSFLGPRAFYLTADSTRLDLIPWLKVLSKYVNALSTYDSAVTAMTHHIVPLHQQPLGFTLLRDAVKLFRVVSTSSVKLRVLDIRNIPLHHTGELGDDLIQGLACCLEHICMCLHELAIPVSEVSKSAIEIVSLPNLHVLHLEYDPVNNLFANNHPSDRCAEALLMMLQAVDGHTDRASPTPHNSFRELRINNMLKAPCMEVRKSGCSQNFFDAITTLRLHVIKAEKDNQSSSTAFINLFSNLECLEWNGGFTGHRVQFLDHACEGLRERELRMNSIRQNIGTGEVAVFPPFHGKLKTFEFHRLCHLRRLDLIQQHNPGLKWIDVHITRACIPQLFSFIGTHCRLVRKLCLTFSGAEGKYIDVIAWGQLTDAILTASKELTDVGIKVNQHRKTTVGDFQAMVQSMLRVLEFLGERAHAVMYSTSLRSIGYGMLVRAVSRIISTCTCHTKNIQHLQAEFKLLGLFFYLNPQERALFEELLLEKDRMWDTLPNLCSLNFGELFTGRHIFRSFPIPPPPTLLPRPT